VAGALGSFPITAAAADDKRQVAAPAQIRRNALTCRIADVFGELDRFTS